MFVWSRTYYCKRGQQYVNIDSKKHRDMFCKEFGFIPVTAKEAYDAYWIIRIEWRQVEDEIRKKRNVEYTIT